MENEEFISVPGLFSYAGGGMDGQETQPDTAQPSPEETGNAAPEQQMAAQAGDSRPVDPWAVPEKFEAPEQELSWYRESYGKVREFLSGEEFAKQVHSKYSEQLAAAEKDVADFRTHYEAFKKDAPGYLKQFLPDYAAELGIDVRLSDEQMASEVDAAMKKEFGEDYAEAFDHKDVINPRSVSRAMQRRSDELWARMEARNRDAEAKAREYTQRLAEGKAQQQAQGQGQGQKQEITAEQQAAWLEKQYAEHFQGMEREEFDGLIRHLDGYTPTLRDIYNGVNHARIVEAARKAAFEEGRKSLLSDLDKAGAKKAGAGDQPRPRTAVPNQGETAHTYRNPVSEIARSIYMNK